MNDRSGVRNALVAVFFTIAVAAALVAVAAIGGGEAGATRGVEGFSSSLSRYLDRLAAMLPLGFAFGAGMVAAVNPCGFAMLPAYLGLYLAAGGKRISSPLRRLAHAATIGGLVTTGFLVLFTVAGAALAAGARSLAGAFPWLGLATGLLLIGGGAWLALGGQLHARSAERLAAGLSSAHGSGPLAYFSFGLAYGLASLSCTLPVFLAVVGSGLTLAGFGATAAQLALYGLGMGTVIMALTVALALFEGSATRLLRPALRYVAPASAILLMAAGSYIVYYWLTTGGLLV